MNVVVYFTPTFSKKYKRYLKKYQSIETDLKSFIGNLPNMEPISLGGNIYKYRLLVKSKNKGKSGGFRIISFEILISENQKDITLLTIYDKSEQASLSKTEIEEIIKTEGLAK
jgi:mRNA-degrading endonuclease RelE of RelBE toxin-antitoxin system